MKNEENSNSNSKYYFTFTFLHRKIYCILIENIFWKNLIYIVTFVLQFFREQVIGNAVKKH